MGVSWTDVDAEAAVEWVPPGEWCGEQQVEEGALAIDAGGDAVAVYGSPARLAAFAKRLLKVAEAAANAALPELPAGTEGRCPAVVDGRPCGSTLHAYGVEGFGYRVNRLDRESGILLIDPDGQACDDGGYPIEELCCDGWGPEGPVEQHYWRIPDYDWEA